MPPSSSSSVALDDAPSAEGGAHAAGASRPPHRRPRWALPALLAIVALPLVVALVALRRTHWYPILDLAMTELRVRDVGTRNTPLIGLPGRIGVIGAEQGSHPGPLSFWALAPTYRLFGSSAWALQVATVVLHTVAMGTALWLGVRRGGLRVAIGLAAMLAILTRAYGADILSEPWNPYMPLLWWVVLMLVAWSVLDGDVAVLPVGAFAATLCAQTHVPYAVVTGGMVALALAGTAHAAWARRSEPERRRHLITWVLVAAAVGAALWLAPVVDQVTRTPGNTSLLIDHFGSPPEESVGVARGVEMTLLHLDPWRLVTEQQTATGSLVDASQAPRGPLVPGAVVPGAVVLVTWVAAVAVAWRLRHHLLLRLHAVVGLGLLLAVVSISRIFGQLSYYLMIWAWGIASLLLLAVVWTAAAAVARRLGDTRRVEVGRIGAGALVAVTLASALVFAVDANRVELPALPLSRTMGALMPDVIDALASGEVTGGGEDGRYLVTWSDALYFGSQGIALVNELERAGFDVGAIEPWGAPVARHRVRAPQDATAVVHLASGFHVERWRAKEGAAEVASIDPRSPEERVEYERLRGEVIDDLRAAGISERIVDVDENLFAVAIDSRVPPSAQDAITRMLDLGLPTAVFVGPVDVMD
ncbi:hypothetical protein BH23ACT2_BH23ACT2_18270 [soil metagenome]